MANTDRFYTAPEGPQVQPDVEMPRRARYEINSSPDMFGGLIAKGLTELGTGATEAYNAYGQVAADQATNNFLGKLTSLRSNLEQTRGQDAIDAFRGKDGQPGAQQQIQSLFDEARSTVPPGHQQQFDNVARRYQSAANSALQSHFEQQSNEWGKVVAKNTDDQAVTSISAHPNDEATFKLNSDLMADAAVKQAQHEYGIYDLRNATPEQHQVIEDTYAHARGRAAYARIEAVRATNPGQADAWQKQYADVLGKLGPEVQQQLKGYEYQQKVQDGVAEADQAIAVPHGTSPAGGPWVKTSAGIFGTDKDGKIDATVKAPAPQAEVAPGAAGQKSPSDVYANIPDTDKQGNPGQVAKFQQWNPDPIGNSDRILSTVHPDLQAVVRKAQQDNPNLPFVVALGKSTPQQQQQAKDWGWSPAGTASHHINGTVVDLWPLDSKQRVDFDPAKQREINTAMQKAAGELGVNLRWGGLASEGGQNHSVRDAPNFELLNPKPWTPSAVPAAYHPTTEAGGIVNPQGGNLPVPDVFFSQGTLAGYKARVHQIENPGNQIAPSAGGAHGYYQFIPSTWAKYGGGADIENRDAQEPAMDRLTADNARQLSYGLGRAPTLSELYLAHQQGAIGALHLLQEPGRRAGDIVGDKAIRLNGGDPNAPASAFTAMWQSKFGGGKGIYYAGSGGTGPLALPGSTPSLPDGSAITAGVQSGTPSGIAVGGIQGTPAVVGGAPDQGGAEGQPQQAGYQPARGEGGIGGGGALGGAPPVTQTGMETAQAEQSPYDIARDHASQAMIYTMGRTDIDEKLKDAILAEQEKKLRYATFAAEQDKATKQLHSDEAVERAFNIAKTDPAAGFRTLDDAQARGVIKPEAYSSAYSLIEKRTGAVDPISMGPLHDDAMARIALPFGNPNRLSSERDLIQLELAGGITKKGHEDLSVELGHMRSEEKTEQNVALMHQSFNDVKSGFRMQMSKYDQGIPGLPKTLRNIKGEELYLTKFAPRISTELAEIENDPKSTPQDVWKFINDTKHMQEVMDSVYPPEQRAKDEQVFGNPQDQAAIAEHNRNYTPGAPPANVDAGAWRNFVLSVPTPPGTAGMKVENWEAGLQHLVAHPDTVKQFSDTFGVNGQVILDDLKAKEPEKAAAPALAPGQGFVPPAPALEPFSPGMQ